MRQNPMISTRRPDWEQQLRADFLASYPSMILPNQASSPSLMQHHNPSIRPRSHQQHDGQGFLQHRLPSSSEIASLTAQFPSSAALLYSLIEERRRAWVSRGQESSSAAQQPRSRIAEQIGSLQQRQRELSMQAQAQSAGFDSQSQQSAYLRSFQTMHPAYSPPLPTGPSSRRLFGAGQPANGVNSRSVGGLYTHTEQPGYLSNNPAAYHHENRTQQRAQTTSDFAARSYMQRPNHLNFPTHATPARRSALPTHSSSAQYHSPYGPLPPMLSAQSGQLTYPQQLQGVPSDPFADVEDESGTRDNPESGRRRSR